MLVTMSDKELSRINVIQSVVEKRMLRLHCPSSESYGTPDSVLYEPLS